MAKVYFTGAENIRKNLKIAEQDMKKKVLAGMIEAAILVKRSMEHIPPLTPVDLGNLRASFFITTVLGVKAGKSPNFRNYNPKNKQHLTDTQFALLKFSHASAVNSALAEVKTAKNLTLIMGYGANYAIWVHEMGAPMAKLDAKGEEMYDKKGALITTWTRPGSGPKWFEGALKDNKTKMLQLIGKEAKITSIKKFTATKKFPEAHTDIEEI